MKVPKCRLSLVVLIMLASCGREDPLVGRWQEVGGNEWAEYFSDGTAIFNDGSMSISGTWKRLEDGRLKIDATVLGTNSTLVYEVSIEGDTATFTSYKGGDERYQRVSTTTRAAGTKEVPSAAGVSSDSAGHPNDGNRNPGSGREAQRPLAGTNQTGSSTAMTTAEALVKASPDLDLVGSDAEAGTLTIRNRQTGEEVTLRADDIEEGRFVFDAQGATNPQLITKNSAGPLQIGMTVAQVRQVLPGRQLGRTTDGEGVALIEVKSDEELEIVLYAGEENANSPINEQATVQFIQVFGEMYKTAEGVHAGMPLNEVEKRYGDLSGITMSEIELREYAQFPNPPAGLSFRVGLPDIGIAGIYPEGKRETKDYVPSAVVNIIEVYGD